MLTELTAVPGAALPVETLKDHLRLGSGFALPAGQDGLLEGYLRAAIAAIEGRIGKALLVRSFRWVVEDWRDPSGVALPVAPVAAVLAVRLVDAFGGETLLPPTAWRLIPDLQRPRLAGAAGSLPPVPTEWNDVTAVFAQQPDVTADFSELRHFSFKQQPVGLTGEVRVSATRGLSLHYLTPEERTVILDARGVLIRAPGGKKTAPADPRAAGANAALLNILRLDLTALAGDFELYGQRDGAAWTLVLVPHTTALRRSLTRITVEGEAGTIRRILLRRSAKHAIEILIAPPRPPAAFTEVELQCYFR